MPTKPLSPTSPRSSFFASTVAIARTARESCPGTTIDERYLEGLRQQLHVVEADYSAYVPEARAVAEMLKQRLAEAPECSPFLSPRSVRTNRLSKLPLKSECIFQASAYDQRMRYHFLRLGSDFEPDVKGTECANLQAARLHAIDYAAETLRSRPDWTGDELRVEVTDDQGKLAATVVLLAIDTKTPGEMIHVTRSSQPKHERASLFVIGSGHAWRKQHDQNR